MKRDKVVKVKFNDSLEAEDAGETDFKKWLIVGGALLLVCAAVFLAQIQYSPQCENITINNTCPVCMANNTYFDLPSEIPNMSAVLKDPLCNDFCFSQSLRYGCDQWANLGLRNGRCECSLEMCIIRIVEDEYGCLE